VTLQDAISKIAEHIRAAAQLARDHTLGNIFYNEGYVDLLIAQTLGHTYNEQTQGPDAYDEDGRWCEYKAINAKADGSFGGSFQFHWLSKPKIEKYRETHRFYFALRDGPEIKEVWSLDASVVVPLLEEKAREKGTLDASKTKTDAHKSFTLAGIKKLGAVKAYPPAV